MIAAKDVVEHIAVDDMGILLNRLGLFKIRELSLITAITIFVVCDT